MDRVKVIRLSQRWNTFSYSLAWIWITALEFMANRPLPAWPKSVRNTLSNYLWYFIFFFWQIMPDIKTYRIFYPSTSILLFQHKNKQIDLCFWPICIFGRLIHFKEAPFPWDHPLSHLDINSILNWRTIQNVFSKSIFVDLVKNNY